MRNALWSILLLTILCSAASAATLSIDPAESTCPYGDTIDLTVMVGDVNNLGGFDIDVEWDPRVVALDTEIGNVTIGPLFSGDVNNSAIYTQSGRIRVAAVNATLGGVSGSAELFKVRLRAIDDTGASTPVKLNVNNYGFLDSISSEDIPVSVIAGAKITTTNQNVVDARIATASNQMITDQENEIIASVVNRRGVATDPLTIEVSIVSDDGQVNELESFSSVTIDPWSKFQNVTIWKPTKFGTYTAIINVTSDRPLGGKPTDTKTITVKEYTLTFNSDIYGPGDKRASAGSWFSMYAYVKASQSGNAWLNITAPDHVEVLGGRNQTRYLCANNWNYVGVSMRTDTPGELYSGDIKFDISAKGKTDSRNGPEVLIWVPSIRVSSVGSTSVNDGQPTGELTFNTLHTNNTYDSATKITVQSGAQGRTLSGLEYLIDYPYGCVEQTTSRMLASLNVKNYYLDRDEKPGNWANIRERANKSVEAGVTRILKASDKGQNSDGGWSLWGVEPSESSSSSYAGYTLARINDEREDLNRLLEGKIVPGNGGIKDGKVNFEKLIEWFHENPDDTDSGTWTWSAHVCHSWTPESNTAFVMLIHDMINQTVDVEEPYHSYMEDNMKNATRYFIDNQNLGSWSSGEDQAMATALALWGLEAFAMSSEDVTEEEITKAKDAATVWLIDAQDDDGSWPATSPYGWHDVGRKTEATAYAVLALNATGLTAENETIQKGVNWIIDQYENGGSWGYTWATQVAIDALIHCQPTEVATGAVDILIDGFPIDTFNVDATNPQVIHTLTEEQMNDLMESGKQSRLIEGGKGEVRSHTLTATSDGATGPILISVEHSQSAPINEIDSRIRDSRLIRSFGYEEEAGLLHISTDIEILGDAPLLQEVTNTYDVEITSSKMVAGEEADVTVKVTPKIGIYAPMIEIPIAGFAFDNKTGISENDDPQGAFEVLNGTTGNDHPSLFIQSVAWNAGDLQTYKFTITPEDRGELDLDLRIRPLYDETNVYLTNKTFTVLGRGNVTVNVVDEDGAPTDAQSITLGEMVAQNKLSHTFTDILEGAYALVVNGTDDYPSIRNAVQVKPGATTLYNVTLPSSLTSPTLVFSEGGAGGIASVEQRPPVLSAAYAENTTYTVTVIGDGGELGIALEFPMRYLMNEPEVKVNGDLTEDYEIINGTFEYFPDTKAYSTTNATLIVHNTTIGSNTIEIEFEGGLLGDALRDGIIEPGDALMILHFYVGNINGFETFDYPFIFNRAEQKIDPTDALMVLHRYVGNVNEFYQ